MKSKQAFFPLLAALGIAALAVVLMPQAPHPLPQPQAAQVAEGVSYDDIRVISERAVTGRIEIPPYEGGPQDFAYLRSYITGMAVRAYGVEASVFDNPTLLSTSLLRDLVHKANWQQPLSDDFKKIVKEKRNIYPLRQDVAEMWRYPSRGVCGHISWSLFNVYKAMGYQADRIDSINGVPGDYSASHVTVDVYLVDAGKFVTQDPTFNMVVLDRQGRLLDFYESRAALPDVVLATFDYALERNHGGPVRKSIPAEKTREIIADYIGNTYTVTAWREGREYKASVANGEVLETRAGPDGKVAIRQKSKGWSPFMF